MYFWLTPCLTARSQVVGIHEKPSQPQPITSGVMKVTVFGSLLLLLYVNDIFRAKCLGPPFLFADSLLFRAIFFTRIHDQYHGGFKITRRVVWVMDNAVLGH